MTSHHDDRTTTSSTALPPIPLSSLGIISIDTYWKGDRLNGVVVPMEDKKQERKRRKQDIIKQHDEKNITAESDNEEIEVMDLQQLDTTEHRNQRSSLIFTQPPDLLRQATMNGNILVLTKNNEKIQEVEKEKEEKEKEEIENKKSNINENDNCYRYLIQRKLRQTSSSPSARSYSTSIPEVISRVGYVLEDAALYPSDGDFFQVKDKQDTHCTNLIKKKTVTSSGTNLRIMNAKDEMMRENENHEMVTIKIQSIKIPCNNDIENENENDNEDEEADTPFVIPNNINEYISNELLALQYIAHSTTTNDNNNSNENHHLEIVSRMAIGNDIKKCASLQPSTTPTTTLTKTQKYLSVPIYAVTPYFNYGTLFDYLSSRSNNRYNNQSLLYLSEKQVFDLFQQILQALQTLHDIKLCHRNISLDSIMLNKEDAMDDSNLESIVCTLTSFEYSLRIPTDNTDNDCLIETPQLIAGTRCLYYYAPELLSVSNNDQKNTIIFDGYAIDLWSCGIILLLLLFGIDDDNNNSHPLLFTAPVPDDPMYYKICIEHQLKELVQKYYDRQQHRTVISPEAIDLIQGILKANPSERYTLQQVLQHPWIIRHQEQQ